MGNVCLKMVRKMARFNVSKVNETVKIESFKKAMNTELFHKKIKIGELAKLSGVTSQKLQAFRYTHNNKLTFDEVVKIATALNIN